MSSDRKPQLPIHLGFIGLSSKGWPATVLAPPLFKAPLTSKYTLVAVSTTNAESAKASAAKYSQLISASEPTDDKSNPEDVVVKAYHGSADHIAQDKDVSMVAVAVKPIYQKDAAMKVIEAGKDLFVEWPVGKNIEETREICEAAKKRGVRTLVGNQMRFSPFALKLKSMVTAGELGKIYSSNFIVSFNRGWGPMILDFFKHSADSANGATLLDAAGGHIFDLIQHILNPVTSLSAVTTNQHPSAVVIDSVTGKPTGETVSQDGPTQVLVNGFLHTSGAGGQAPFAVHIQSGVKDAELMWIISGEKGTIRVQADSKFGFFDPSPELFWNGEKIDTNLDAPKAPNSKEDRRIAMNWETFANGKKGVYADVEDALRTKKVLDAVVRSTKEGKRIDL